jgi:hypothetical protein
LQQRLQKHPTKTLQLFYRLTELSDPLTNLADHLPYPIEHLQWGLEQLATLKADSGFLSRVKAFTGSMDPLINRREMQSIWSTCHFVDNCNHDYHKLLTTLSNQP